MASPKYRFQVSIREELVQAPYRLQVGIYSAWRKAVGVGSSTLLRSPRVLQDEQVEESIISAVVHTVEAAAAGAPLRHLVTPSCVTRRSVSLSLSLCLSLVLFRLSSLTQESCTNRNNLLYDKLVNAVQTDRHIMDNDYSVNLPVTIMSSCYQLARHHSLCRIFSVIDSLAATTAVTTVIIGVT